MVFESLSEKLQATLRRLKGRGKLSERDVNDALREVRLALLEADVNFKVVKDFIARVKERAVGQEVMKSLTPGQQGIKIVNEELTHLMGDKQEKLQLSDSPPSVILLVGLQGSGKTTTVAKLGHTLKKSGKSVMFTACDVYRPAAIRQLEVLGEKLDVPVYSRGQKAKPVNIAAGSVKEARQKDIDVVLIDTAGRLHVDDKLMDELSRIKRAVNPCEVILVVDAMTGQDAVNVAESFDECLGIDSLILTKLDSDTRGGAALSIRAVTGKPIKYVGMGEKIDMLEPFFPDRMASRILGMGDVMSLIEKAQDSMDAEEAKKMAKKFQGQEELTLDDFKAQLHQLKNMGPIDNILNMIPGVSGAKGLKNLSLDEKEFVKVEAIIDSMTRQERAKPGIINSGRRKRIALGSGTKVQDVNRLLKQFKDSKKMIKQMSKMGMDQKGKGKGIMSLFR